MDINFTIASDKLTSDIAKPISGNVNYYKCNFTFSDEWAELAKFAVFSRKDRTYTIEIKDGSCFIPKEVLTESGNIAIGVFGTNASETEYIRISTNPVTALVSIGAYKEGDTPETPTPDVWEEYLKQINKAAASVIPYINESDKHWYVYDAEKQKYVDSGVISVGDKGADGYTPIRGKDYWTEADQSAISADLDGKIADKVDKKDGYGLISYIDNPDENSKSVYTFYIATEDRITPTKEVPAVEWVQYYLAKKADQTALTYLTNTVHTISDKVYSTTDGLDTKASKTALEALKKQSVPHADVAKYPISLNDSLANEPLLECKIYGGHNLFNMNLLTNSRFELHPDENYFDVSGYSVMAMEMSQFMSMTGLKAGDTVTTSRTVEVVQGEFVGSYGRITLLSRKSGIPSLVLCEYTNNIQTATLPEDFDIDNYYGLYVYGTNTTGGIVRMHDLQIVKGVYTADTMPPYQPYGNVGDLDSADNKYKISITISGGDNLSNTVTVSLDTPLSQQEYIDVINKKRYNGSTVSDITVSGELKTLDSDVNNIKCSTAISPSKIELSYYQDINKVITNLTNAILAQGGNE